MNHKQDRPKNFDLKQVGLKMTTPRLRILSFLTQSDKRHMCAEEIYQHLVSVGEDIGLATVYRVLTQFEQAGLVRRHRFGDESFVFEIEQGEHHDHWVCVCCGLVSEFADPVIEARQQYIADLHDFVLTDHALTLYGICKICQSTQDAS
jgi:Fur family ferric uptake transcriptional regulator